MINKGRYVTVYPPPGADKKFLCDWYARIAVAMDTTNIPFNWTEGPGISVHISPPSKDPYETWDMTKEYMTWYIY